MEDADVVLINTCAVREKPERKLFAELGRLRNIKLRNPHMVIGVTGCMAPREKDILRMQAPHVDLLLGPRSIHRLPDLLRQVELHRRPVEEIDLYDDPTHLTPVRRASKVSAWVDVMFGCNYACTFCAVPTARGKEISRVPSEILDEIDQLTQLGYKEITLLGQTVNAYGRDFRYRLPGSDGRATGDRIDFTWLLEQIDRRSPKMRVRFTSPHPQLFSGRLVRAITDLPTVCEHVHLPLQSADNDILRRMKRAYTFEKYRRIVDSLREAVPDISITTDIIVGFPGETEDKFQRTLKAFEEIEFDQAFMFIYSPRRHTEALKYEDKAVPPDVQKRRLQELVDIANVSFQRKNSRYLGRSFEVLVEGPSEKNPNRMRGRTRGDKTVIFDCSRDMIGRLVNIRATSAHLWGFKGEVAAELIESAEYAAL